MGAIDPHTPVAQGWLRASHRKLDPKLSTAYRPYHTHDEKQPLKPGEVVALDIEIWPTSIVVPGGLPRSRSRCAGKDYEWQKSTGARLSNFKNELRGCGPFLHDDPRDRPGGASSAARTTLHLEAIPTFSIPVISMKLYGFWRSLATYRVKVALALKGMKVDEEVSIDLLKGQQHDAGLQGGQSAGGGAVAGPRRGGPPLFQSLAIIEYLEETKPQPPLLPKDPRGRARVRGLALIVGRRWASAGRAAHPRSTWKRS